MCRKNKNISYLCTDNQGHGIMIITREVQKRLEDFQPDYVFTYRDLNLPAETSESIIKMLNRLAGEGYLAKISKGRFYKPKKSVFGTLKPRQEELVKDLLEKNGKRIGYLTGYSVFNRLGLTTQVPNIIQIGTNQRRNKKQRDIFTVCFVLQPNPITKDNIPLLQLLDAIRFIKEIPDTTIEASYRRIAFLVGELGRREKEKMVALAEAYPPMVRALLGTIIENDCGMAKAQPLWDSLNPVTVYKLGISEDALPNKKKWKIS